ncbi:MAG TPA: ABC transporter permease [Egicoccus sp.]|nr:ABC transporter permease [Egicoccus sp.]HSK21881.1 ABC transporter permease [Egicoccus sp.]
MNRNLHAIKVGSRRGWHEFVLSLKSPQDQGFYLFMALGILAYLWFNRDNELEGTGLFMPTYAMPSILGGLIAFGLVIGPAYALAMEREDGTLLRAKALPRGLVGYVTGQVVLHSASLVPTFVVILVPGLLLFDDLMHRGAAGWVTVTWVILLGLLATLPLGIIIGSLVPGVQKVGTWGMLPIMVLAGISGIFFPFQALWGWLQAIAQVFPLYWLGLGMRSAFLPDAAAVMEVGGSWRTLQTVLVLAVWAVVGALLTPRVLRRMAQRQSGSAVAAAREQAGQWIR